MPIIETRFEFKDFTRVFLLSLLLYVGFIGIFSWVPSLEAWMDARHPTVVFFIQYLVQFVILFFPLWIFVVSKYRATPADFGLKRIGIGKVVGTAIVGYLAYIIISMVLLSLLVIYDIYLPGYEAQDPYLPLFGTDLIGFTTAGLFLLFIGPFIEEVLFRGFIYNVFNTTWPTWFASLLSAILFALIHFQLQNIIPLIFLGILLNYVYHRTGSIWTAVAFHMLNNTVAFILEIVIFYNPTLLEDLEALIAFLYNGLML